MYFGIEIGGTKLQLGVGPGDGTMTALWRDVIHPADGPDGIRTQIQTGFPALLEKAGASAGDINACGIGFGGPVDDVTRTVIKSHQIKGWDDFGLADWVSDVVGLPAVLGNDADVAGLAEALFGAGKGLSPVFYVTVGSGIGGGLILDGEIYRGTGRGAAEIGHLKIAEWAGGHRRLTVVEEFASGWGIQERAKQAVIAGEAELLGNATEGAGRRLDVPLIADCADRGDAGCRRVLQSAWEALAEGITHVIALLCPRRVVIGGGVSLLGEQRFFEPLRALVAERVFPPFAGEYDIVPAALGEEVVVHGALALARQRFPPT